MAELTPIITAVLLKFTSVLLMTLIGQVSHQPKTLHMLCYLKGKSVEEFITSLKMSHSALTLMKKVSTLKQCGDDMALVPPFCPPISMSGMLTDKETASYCAF